MYEQEFVFDPPPADGTCTDENIKEVFGSMMKTLFHIQRIYMLCSMYVKEIYVYIYLYTTIVSL